MIKNTYPASTRGRTNVYDNTGGDDVSIDTTAPSKQAPKAGVAQATAGRAIEGVGRTVENAGTPGAAGAVNTATTAAREGIATTATGVSKLGETEKPGADTSVTITQPGSPESGYTKDPTAGTIDPIKTKSVSGSILQNHLNKANDPRPPEATGVIEGKYIEEHPDQGTPEGRAAINKQQKDKKEYGAGRGGTVGPGTRAPRSGKKGKSKMKKSNDILMKYLKNGKQSWEETADAAGVEGDPEKVKLKAFHTKNHMDIAGQFDHADHYEGHEDNLDAHSKDIDKYLKGHDKASDYDHTQMSSTMNHSDFKSTGIPSHVDNGMKAHDSIADKSGNTSHMADQHDFFNWAHGKASEHLGQMKDHLINKQGVDPKHDSISKIDHAVNLHNGAQAAHGNARDLYDGTTAPKSGRASDTMGEHAMINSSKAFGFANTHDNTFSDAHGKYGTSVKDTSTAGLHAAYKDHFQGAAAGGSVFSSEHGVSAPGADTSSVGKDPVGDLGSHDDFKQSLTASDFLKGYLAKGPESSLPEDGAAMREDQSMSEDHGSEAAPMTADDPEDGADWDNINEMSEEDPDVATKLALMQVFGIVPEGMEGMGDTDDEGAEGHSMGEYGADENLETPEDQTLPDAPEDTTEEPGPKQVSRSLYRSTDVLDQFLGKSNPKTAIDLLKTVL